MGRDGANGLMGGRDVFSQVGEKVFLDGGEICRREWERMETKKGILTDLMKENMLESSIAPLIFTTFCSYVIQNSYLCSLI